MSCSNVVAKGKTPKPSKKELEALLKTMSIRQVAELYGRTKSTVSFWKKQYEL